MIAFLRGTLIHKTPTEVSIDVQGVGYALSIPLSTYERLGDVNTQVALFTYLHVREDALHLFGFHTEEERSLFKLLISVSGIGPKVAQSILSGSSVTELKDDIAQGNLSSLTRIPGVGRKIAERLIVELRDKVGRVDAGAVFPVSATDGQSRIRHEAWLALISLGYSRPLAEKALRAAVAEKNGKEATVEELIKASLRHAGK